MAVSNLLPSFLATMKWEGGEAVSVDPHDAGNWSGGMVGVGRLEGSKWGISANVAARSFLGVRAKDLTADQALAVFKPQYWDATGCDGLPVGLDHCVSDDAYNAGAANARRLYAKVSGLAPIAAIKEFSRLRLSFLRALKQWPRYGVGWAHRVGGVEAEALQMHMESARVPHDVQTRALRAYADSVATSARAHVTKAVAVTTGAPAAHVAAVSVDPAATLPLEILAGLLIVAALGFVFASIATHARAAAILEGAK